MIMDKLTICKVGMDRFSDAIAYGGTRKLTPSARRLTGVGAFCNSV